MRVYEATLVDKWSTPFEGEHSSYQGYIVVDDENNSTKATDWEMFCKGLKRETGFTDEDILYYFTEDEFKPKDGEIETEEFKCLIGKRAA